MYDLTAESTNWRLEILCGVPPGIIAGNLDSINEPVEFRSYCLYHPVSISVSIYRSFLRVLHVL